MVALQRNLSRRNLAAGHLVIQLPTTRGCAVRADCYRTLPDKQRSTPALRHGHNVEQFELSRCHL